MGRHRRPDAATHWAPAGFDTTTRTLRVLVDSPAWATQLRLRTRQVLALLDQHLTPGSVRALDVRVANKPAARTEHDDQATAVTPRHTEPAPGPAAPPLADSPAYQQLCQQMREQAQARQVARDEEIARHEEMPPPRPRAGEIAPVGERLPAVIVSAVNVVLRTGEAVPAAGARALGWRLQMGGCGDQGCGADAPYRLPDARMHCGSTASPHHGRSRREGMRDMEKEELYTRDISGARWRKSSRSLLICVEVAEIGGGAVALRDSKNPHLGDLRFTTDEWAAFREGVRDGEFG